MKDKVDISIKDVDKLFEQIRLGVIVIKFLCYVN